MAPESAPQSPWSMSRMPASWGFQWKILLIMPAETPSKKERLEFGNQRLNRFQQLDPMAGGLRKQSGGCLRGHCDCESCKAFPERCQAALRLKHGAACEERRSLSGAFSLHRHCLSSAMVGLGLAAVDLVPEKAAAVAFIH
ncbi:hypothetical protein CK203_116321 [Vitis vinifera]|uniref:Uncharacterized protein n=1 Tax=Vitis vinifera TaxID=29760 RepID=A0A438FE77_VITVI|nr:hypothetical protein CK203_116321 [Vitis vinifera]